MVNHEMISEIYYHAVEESRDMKKPSPSALARQKSYEKVETLKKSLNEEEKKLFEQILQDRIDMECVSNEENFVLGFRTGTKLMDEILEKDSRLS
ncbi:MAG: hypothetical protein R3Y63_09845 [Eubacteriales bacterium]